MTSPIVPQPWLPGASTDTFASCSRPGRPLPSPQRFEQPLRELRLEIEDEAGDRIAVRDLVVRVHRRLAADLVTRAASGVASRPALALPLPDRATRRSRGRHPTPHPLRRGVHNDARPGAPRWSTAPSYGPKMRRTTAGRPTPTRVDSRTPRAAGTGWRRGSSTSGTSRIGDRSMILTVGSHRVIGTRVGNFWSPQMRFIGL